MALEDQLRIAGWDTNVDIAQACRSVLGDMAATELGERLGRSAWDVLQVAIELGYDEVGA